MFVWQEGVVGGGGGAEKRDEGGIQEGSAACKALALFAFGIRSSLLLTVINFVQLSVQGSLTG